MKQKIECAIEELGEVYYVKVYAPRLCHDHKGEFDKVILLEMERIYGKKNKPILLDLSDVKYIAFSIFRGIIYFQKHKCNELSVIFSQEVKYVVDILSLSTIMRVLYAESER